MNRQAYHRLLKILFDTGVHLVFLYRLMHFLHPKPIIGDTLASLIRWFIRIYTSCDIAPTAVIGKNLKLPHPLGIVIGDQVEIGDSVMIFQQVTLDSHGKQGQPMAYPQIGDAVRIYPKATVIGRVNIGKNAVIGAHSLVLYDVPENRTAVGAPARILPEQNNGK